MLRRALIAVWALTLVLASPALALSPGVELLLNGGSAPSWSWNPVATNALPADGSVTVASPSLGGLVLDATNTLTFAGNNALVYASGTTLATQTTASALGTQRNYLLCMYGTGSVALSGGFSGSLAGTGASNQVSLKFVPSSAAALTVTVTGSVTSASLSAVTYETSCRPQDQVFNATAYYGPKCDFGYGCRGWEARTNYFLNSLVGVTQNVTTTATPYTLSCWGTGTITLTGTSTAGPLTCSGATPTSTITPTSLTFTPAAGTLTLTVAGSATYVNLEQGSYPSARIPTGASAVTASADSIVISDLSKIGGFNAAAGSFGVEFSGLQNIPATPIITEFENSDNSIRFGIGQANFNGSTQGTNIITYQVNGTVTVLNLASSPDGVRRVMTAWGNTFSASIGGGSVISGEKVYITPARLSIGNRYGAASYCNCYIRSLAFWPSKTLTPAQQQNKSNVGAQW